MLLGSGLEDPQSVRQQANMLMSRYTLRPKSFCLAEAITRRRLCSALQHGHIVAENGLVDLPFGALEGSGGLPAALAASSLRRLRSCTPACHRRFWCLIHAAGSSCLQCSQINALLQVPSLNDNVEPACCLRCRLLLARLAHDHQLPV